MAKMDASGGGIRARLTATSYEVIDLPDGTVSQEIEVGTAVADTAYLIGPSPGPPIRVTLSAIMGVKIDVRYRGKAECICDGDSGASVENITMAAIEVDDLT